MEMEVLISAGIMFSFPFDVAGAACTDFCKFVIDKSKKRAIFKTRGNHSCSQVKVVPLGRGDRSLSGLEKTDTGFGLS
jgi:hypothetical protein